MKQKEYNEMLGKIKCSEEFKNKMENMLKNSPEKDQEYTDSVSSVERAPKFTLRRYAAAAAAFAIICGSVGTVWYKTSKDKHSDNLHEVSDEPSTDITTGIAATAAETTIVTATNAVTTTTVTTTAASSGHDNDKQQRIADQIIDNVFSVETCDDAAYLPYSDVSFIYGITPIPTDISEFLHGFEWEQVEGDAYEFQTGSGPFVFENVYRFFSNSHRLFVNEKGQIWDGEYLVFNAKNIKGDEFASYLSKLSRDKELRVEPTLLRQDLDNAVRKLCNENSIWNYHVRYLREPDSVMSGFEPFYIDADACEHGSVDENNKVYFVNDFMHLKEGAETKVELPAGKNVELMLAGSVFDDTYNYCEMLSGSGTTLKTIYGDDINLDESNHELKTAQYDLSSDWEIAPPAKYYPILKRITNRLVYLPYTQANEFYANYLESGEDVQVTYNNNDNGHNVSMRFVVDKDFVIKEYTEYRDDQLICEFKITDITKGLDACG